MTLARSRAVARRGTMSIVEPYLPHVLFAPADFIWMTELLMAVADSHCGGRLVSALEGGYEPEAVALSGAAHVGALMRH